MYLRQEDAVARLEQDSTRGADAIEKQEASIETISADMAKLKQNLYAKFGNAINLEV